MIDSRLLRCAVALARHRSFARAAAALAISQPTLSRNIQTLEQKLGARLFDRLPRSTVATPVGEELLRHAHNVLAANQALEDGVQQFIGLETGSLSIGAGIAVAGGILGPSLVRFQASWPEVALRSLVADWRRLPGHLRQGDIELFAGEISECQHDKDLDITAFPRHQAYFCCRKGHPLLGQQDLCLAEILSWPLVLPEMPARFQQGVQARLRADGVALSAIPNMKTIVSNDLAVNRTMIVGSDVLGLATFGMAEAALLSGEMLLLPCRLPELRTRYGVVSRQGMSLSPAAQAFVGILRQQDDAMAAREQAFFGAAQPVGEALQTSRSQASV